MTLIARIEADTISAMKSKDEGRLSALRMVRAALKNKLIEIGHTLSDDEAQQVIRTMVKQYTEALADFTSAGRTDLAEKQQKEIDLLKEYLPAQMPEEEIEMIARKIIAAQNAAQKDMGRVMGAVMKEVAGRADGNAVKALVQKILG
ncbi:MAG: GatB/YqeY domain-containing protein [Patescibacteria group bacterium]